MERDPVARSHVAPINDPASEASIYTIPPNSPRSYDLIQNAHLLRLTRPRPRCFCSGRRAGWLGQARLVKDWLGPLEELLRLHPRRFC